MCDDEPADDKDREYVRINEEQNKLLEDIARQEKRLEDLDDAMNVLDHGEEYVQQRREEREQERKEDRQWRQDGLAEILKIKRRDNWSVEQDKLFEEEQNRHQARLAELRKLRNAGLRERFKRGGDL
jgi:hypothetical protein